MGVAIPINSAGITSESTAPPVIGTVRKLSSFRRMKNKMAKNGKFLLHRNSNKKAGSNCDRTENTAEMSRSGEGDRDDNNNYNTMLYYPVDIINGHDQDQAQSPGSELSLPMELENGRGSTHGDQGCDVPTIDQCNEPPTERGCQSQSSFSYSDPPPDYHSSSKIETPLVSTTATIDSQGKCPHHQFIQLKRISPRTGEWQTLMNCCPLCEAAQDGSIIASHSVLLLRSTSSKIATAHRRRLMQWQSRLHSQPMYQPVNTDDYVEEASDDDDDDDNDDNDDCPTISSSISHLSEDDEEGESSILQGMEPDEALVSIAKLQSGNDAIRQSMNEVTQLANKVDDRVAHFIQHHNANVKGYEEKISMLKEELRRKEKLFATLDAMREENEVLVSLMIMGEEEDDDDDDDNDNDDESFLLSSEDYTEEEVMELIAEKEEEAYEHSGSVEGANLEREEEEDDDADLTCKVLQIELMLLRQTLGELEGRR